MKKITLLSFLAISSLLHAQYNALDFDGVDDYVEIPMTDDINFTEDQDFTILLWVKIPNDQTDLSVTDNSLIGLFDGYAYPYVLRTYNSTSSEYGKVGFGRFDGMVVLCTPPTWNL